MYWIVFLLLLESSNGIVVNEHWLEPVSTTKEACERMVYPAYFLTAQSSGLQGRLICKKRGTVLPEAG